MIYLNFAYRTIPINKSKINKNGLLIETSGISGKSILLAEISGSLFFVSGVVRIDSCNCSLNSLSGLSVASSLLLRNKKSLWA